jgi:hypothetical protein
VKERRQYSHEEYTYSTKIGSAIGFLMGWAIGVGLVFYIDSPALYEWPLVPSIPIWEAIGWGLFGMIAGSGGIFADLKWERTLHRAPHVSSRETGRLGTTSRDWIRGDA